MWFLRWRGLVLVVTGDDLIGDAVLALTVFFSDFGEKFLRLVWSGVREGGPLPWVILVGVAGEGRGMGAWLG